MKKIVPLLICLLAPADFSFAQTSDDPNYDQARQEYRMYLRELKKLGQQYKALTGEIQKVMKEEGFPTWDESQGRIGISHEFPVTTYPGGDITETDREMTVQMDLPGVKKNDIKVSIQDGIMLKVKAVRDDAPIERIIPLPAQASDKGPRAKYEDGVLTVTITKAPQSQKQVTVPVH